MRGKGKDFWDYMNQHDWLGLVEMWMREDEKDDWREISQATLYGMSNMQRENRKKEEKAEE